MGPRSCRRRRTLPIERVPLAPARSGAPSGRQDRGWGEVDVGLILVTALWVATAGAEAPAAPAAPAGQPSVGGSGIVVRLQADPVLTSAPTVALSAGGVKVVETTLNDDGKDPDVTGSDGMWSGATFASGDSFTVSVIAAGKPLGTADVAWKPADAQRDLTLTWSGGKLAAEAGVSVPAPAPGEEVAASPPSSPAVQPAVAGSPGATPASPPSPGGTPPGPGGTPPAPGGTPPAPGGVASSADATWYLVFGGALLAAATIGYFWFRSRGAPPALALPPGVARVNERGLFGPGTPAACGVPSAWSLSSEAREECVAGLLGALAHGRRVLVVVADGEAVPSVAGGPVHRIAPSSTDAVLDAADELLGSDSGGVVLWLAGLPEGADLAAFVAELPRGVGLIAAGGGGEATWPAAALAFDGAWSVESGGQRVALRLGPTGFSEA